MSKVGAIIIREINERIKSRSFLLMAVIGPLITLSVLYALFSLSGSEKQHWNVLIMDKAEVFENKLMPKPDPILDFTFINEFVDYEQFANLEQFQEYDLAVWINEKVVSNKQAIVAYRELPSQSLQRRLIYHIERRLEEVMIDEFTELSVGDFRAIKQPLNFSFKNTYDPKNEISYQASWVGYCFGGFILLFVFLFGTGILRSLAKEKSNRITELLLSSTSAKKLLSGKIIGIGIAALFQFVVWVLIIGLGLFLFRQTFFPDLVDPALVAEQLSAEVASANTFELTKNSYNAIVELVYHQINFGSMISFFIFFFIGAYLFYGAFFAAIGAGMGSESDGQSYTIPLTLLLFLSLLSGYYAIYYGGTTLVSVLSYIPFTSPIIMMIKLANGFSSEDVWQLFVSLFTLYLGSAIVLHFVGKIYKNGIIQFGHRLSFSHFWNWLKN